MTSFVVILCVVAAVALGVIGYAIISADVHIARLEKRVEALEQWADQVGKWATESPPPRPGPPLVPFTYIVNGEPLIPVPRPDLPNPGQR